MALSLVLCFVAAVAFSNVNALTQEEADSIQSTLLKYVSECSSEHGVTVEQVKEAKEKHSLDEIDSCAIGCVLKKAEFINDEGLFDPEKAKESSTKMLSDEQDKKRFAEIADECASVNEEQVSDGDKGCERAKLVLHCLGKYKDEIKV